MSTGVLAVIGSSKAGIDMVFGPLADLSKVELQFCRPGSAGCYFLFSFDVSDVPPEDHGVGR